MEVLVCKLYLPSFGMLMKTKHKDKADDVWDCIEWESPLRVQDMRASTSGVERCEKEMEWKSRSRLLVETWKKPWFQRENDAPTSPNDAI